MSKNRKSCMAIAVLLAAGFWLVWPRQQRGATATNVVADSFHRLHEPGTLTFSKDIAPIILNNCASCHRPGEVAPFSLLSYQDVKKRATQIAYVTQQRIMPPWKAEQGDFGLQNERRLTSAQIAMIKQWVDEGAPLGDPREMPARPAFSEGWQLGKPDLVVKMNSAFVVPADGPDIYRNFVLPLNLGEDKWIKALEFRPGARSVVHHSLFFYDVTGVARKQDDADPLPGYAGGMGSPGVGFRGDILRRPVGGQTVTRGSLGGWAVGAQAHVLPEGLSWFVPKGSDLVLSTHFHPSGKAEEEISTVGIYFADKAPTRKFTRIQLPPLFGIFAGIDIPPGAKEYTITDSFVLPVEVQAFGVGAHAHYLGKQLKLTAQFPGGETKTLLWIRDWDFAWQDQYQFKEFISLPRGTRLNVTVSYDNSADNPHNSTSPPARVRWGENSTDEMGSMTLMVVAAKETELPELQQAYRRHVQSAFIKADLTPLRLLGSDN